MYNSSLLRVGGALAFLSESSIRLCSTAIRDRRLRQCQKQLVRERRPNYQLSFIVLAGMNAELISSSALKFPV